ncbi:MAG: hypothetical protein R3D26_22705 [Cyanobacteriota/Melainabacteria group bacterium]
MSISTRGFESADLPTNSAKASTAGDFASFDLKSLSVDDMAAPSKAALPNVSISESPAIEPRTISLTSSIFARSMSPPQPRTKQQRVSSRLHHRRRRSNSKKSNKAVIAQDGNLNIQVEGGGSARRPSKQPNEAQKATAKRS